MTQSIKIGISSCLLGEKTRYDGTDKEAGPLIDQLRGLFHLVSICPEVDIGLGVPRGRIELVGGADAPRAIYQSANPRDVTDTLKNIANTRQADLCGYVLKSGSPSCGISQVAVQIEGTLHYNGTGIFAKEIMRLYPGIPVTDEKELANPLTSDNFIDMVSAYHDSRATAN